MRNEAIQELKDEIKGIDGIIQSLGYLATDSKHQSVLFS